MADVTDFTKFSNDMMAALLDRSLVTRLFKTQAELGEKGARIVMDSAEATTDLAARQSRETLDRLRELTRARQQPGDYAAALTTFVSSQAEGTMSVANAWLEIARKMQTDSSELLMQAGRSAMTETASAMPSAAPTPASAPAPTVAAPVAKPAAARATAA